MNHVGLGANVVEENTSFNTYRDDAGLQLDGRTGSYSWPSTPHHPWNYFWSVTLYLADSGRVFDNELSRYSLGGTVSDSHDNIRLVHPVRASRRAVVDRASWLPALEEEFFLVLRAYGPKDELLNGTWVPAGVRRVNKDVGR